MDSPASLCSGCDVTEKSVGVEKLQPCKISLIKAVDIDTQYITVYSQVFVNMPRKKPFSNKQKKKQLQVKRERKRGNRPVSGSMLALAVS